MTTTSVDDITRFWRHLFAPGEGQLQIWSGVRDQNGNIPENTVKSKYFVYPAKAERAADWALERSRDNHREVYFCAHLLKGRRRRKENAAEIRALWGDLDGAEIPNSHRT